MKTFLPLLFFATVALGQQAAPIFPPGATLEQKKAIIQERAQAARFDAMLRDQAARAKAADAYLKSEQSDPWAAPRKSIAEVETDQPAFLNKPIILSGKLRLSTYFNYAFSEARESCFAFDLTDDSGHSASLYIGKAAGAEIRARILKEGSIQADCSIVIASGFYDKTAPHILAVLVAARDAAK